METARLDAGKRHERLRMQARQSAAIKEKAPSDLKFLVIRRATGVLLVVRFLGVALCLQTFELASVSFGSCSAFPQCAA